jgi:hypothetical protein
MKPKTYIYLFFLFIIFLNSSLSQAKTIFDNLSVNELKQKNSLIIKKLMLTKLERKKALQKTASLNNERVRAGQLLILRDKKPIKKITIDYLNEYLTETYNCLINSSLCLSEESNEYISSFYTYLNAQNINEINESIDQISDYKRAKIINLALSQLNLGVQESISPNEDPENYIQQYFEAAGLLDPNKELGSDKINNWAWCSAFITSIINQAGYGFSFIQIKDYLKVCNDFKAKENCHPVQVDFVLAWAKKYKLDYEINTNNLNELKAGDLLIMTNLISGRANHIGFYLGKDKACQLNPENCWIYSLEGNAGPLINDALEDNWSEIITLKNNKTISNYDYERLLDRVTLVKRPLNSWSYFIKIN